MSMTMDAARAVLDEVIRIARHDGLRLSIAIVDDQGHPVCSARMDGANWYTLGVATAKAQTAAVFKRPSHALARLKEQYPELLPLMEDQVPFRPTVLPGGVPLEAAGVVGAIGISGAHPDTDLAIAEAAAKFFAAASA